MNNFFIEILKFFGSNLNYGYAIILLTLLVKLVFWPLTGKQYESMAAMRKVQPKLKDLQQKHAKEPQVLQQKMMALYKEHNVNPFSGCLPMLIQLPILLVLYASLNSVAFINLDGGKEFLWINDISFKETQTFANYYDENKKNISGETTRENALYKLIQSKNYSGSNSNLPYALPVLAFLVALTTYFSQKTMGMDKEQEKMMLLMPVVMMLVCLNLSAGISIYLLISNLFAGLQQLYMLKKIPPNTIAVKQLK
ncbi:inner membrane protein translocase component YidC [Candidatus Termititenax dinenymphae]|uniref:Inner membrane protein translocase component YidC n=1 Tax=Candidatus Termititenax dinenymphae TaxID=2218523 RepID=A0A388TJJ5_9BACT|nr:inner membrane protein translocase component YidC [Candidatus Termititenax dinenymphae]